MDNSYDLKPTSETKVFENLSEILRTASQNKSYERNPITEINTFGNLTEILGILDNRYAVDNAASLVYLVLLMLAGLVGNSVVFYVFWAKMSKSTSRLFILSLCVIDLLTCLISMPLHVFNLTHHYTFGSLHSSVPCKLSFFAYFTTLGSGHILVALGAVRLKMTKPWSKQVSYFMAKVAITLSLVIAAVVSTPAFVLYGAHVTPTQFPDINGSLCTISGTYISSRWNFGYLCLLFLWFVAGAVVLMTLYWRILVRVSTFANKSPLKNQHISGSKDDISGDGGGLTRVARKESSVKDGSSKRRQSARRTTVMLFLVTLGYVLSYLPNLSIQTARTLHWDTFNNLEGGSLAVYNLFLRSFYINNVINPFIYFACDLNVRREVRALFLFAKVKGIKT